MLNIKSLFDWGHIQQKCTCQVCFLDNKMSSPFNVLPKLNPEKNLSFFNDLPRIGNCRLYGCLLCGEKKLFGVTFFSPTREGVCDRLWFLYLVVSSLAATDFKMSFSNFVGEGESHSLISSVTVEGAIFDLFVRKKCHPSNLGSQSLESILSALGREVDTHWTGHRSLTGLPQRDDHSHSRSNLWAI